MILGVVVGILLQFLLFVPSVICCTTYQWSNVRIGGGGYMLGIIPHPSVPNLVYARTDVGGVYKFNFSGQNWVSLSDSLPVANQFSVESLAVDRANPKIVYAAFGNGKFATSGIYKSADQGATWLPTGLQYFYIYGNGDYRWAGERLLVDAFNSSIVWFGSRQNGLYMSSNAGASWRTVLSVPNGVTFVVQGSKQQALYVGVYGVGVFNLVGSNEFSRMIGSPVWPVRASVAVDGTLFVTSDIGIHRYKSGRWNRFQPGGNTTYCAVTTDPQDPSFVIASVIAWQFNNPYFVSTDGGDSWKQFNRSTVEVQHDVPWWPLNFFAAATASITIDPHNSSHGYMSDWFGTYFTQNIKSTTPVWATHESGHEEVVVLTLASHPTIPLLSGTADVSGFVHNSIFAFPNHSIQPLQNTVSIDFSERTPSFIAKSGTTAHTPVPGQPGGCYSTDSGNTWNYFKSQIGNGGRLAVSATSQRIVYIPIGQGPRYSDDSGSNWLNSTGVSSNVVPTSLSFLCPPLYLSLHSHLLPLSYVYGYIFFDFFYIWQSASPLASDRVNGSVFYVLDKGDFKISTNGGVYFVPIYSFSTTGYAQVLARPGAAGEVWVCGGGLYRTTNYGRSFSKIQTVETCDGMLSFGKGRTTSSVTVVYIKGTVNGVNGFYRSENFGTQWVRIDIPSNPMARGAMIAGDRTAFGRVYVGSSGRGIYYGHDVCA